MQCWMLKKENNNKKELENYINNMLDRIRKQKLMMNIVNMKCKLHKVKLMMLIKLKLMYKIIAKCIIKKNKFNSNSNKNKINNNQKKRNYLCLFDKLIYYILVLSNVFLKKIVYF